MLVLINHGRVPRRYERPCCHFQNIKYSKHKCLRYQLSWLLSIILMKDMANHHLNADIFLELYLGFITGSFCASLKWVTDISSRSRIVYSTATVFIGIICTYRTSHKSWAFCSVLESFSWQRLPSSLCLLYSLPPKWVRCICFGIIYLTVTLLTGI